MDKASADNATTRVGEISGVHGVKGWVKIYSETAPKEKIFEYAPWSIVDQSGVSRAYKLLNWQSAGKGLIAQLEGIDDRDQALAMMGSVIEVGTDRFEPLEDGQYYWFQLQGLKVISRYKGQDYNLGVVQKLMETGANDVLVVKSEDGQERLIPWTPKLHVLKVDLDMGQIEVDWDPDF